MAQSNRGLLQWPQSILGPRPGLKELNVVCWSLFVIGLIFPLSVFLWVRWKSGAAFSSLLPIDFIYFYGIGHILNHHPVAQLYDYGLQLKTFNDIYPLSENHRVWGRSPYPPFVAKFFSIYARFSFEHAYFLWMGTSFTLFIAGIVSALKAALPKDRLRGSLIFCFAISLTSVPLLQPRRWATRHDSSFFYRSRNRSREALHAAPQRAGTVDTDL